MFTKYMSSLLNCTEKHSQEFEEGGVLTLSSLKQTAVGRQQGVKKEEEGATTGVVEGEGWIIKHRYIPFLYYDRFLSITVHVFLFVLVLGVHESKHDLVDS